jgi:hypothetical protein
MRKESPDSEPRSLTLLRQTAPRKNRETKQNADRRRLSDRTNWLAKAVTRFGEAKGSCDRRLPCKRERQAPHKKSISRHTKAELQTKYEYDDRGTNPGIETFRATLCHILDRRSRPKDSRRRLHLTESVRSRLECYGVWRRARRRTFHTDFRDQQSMCRGVNELFHAIGINRRKQFRQIFSGNRSAIPIVTR